MRRDFLKCGAMILALSTPLGACAWAPATPVAWSKPARCPIGTHTEAYPNDPRPNHAYGCVSDSFGFIRSPGDSREVMRPL
jgi:hypothetical protein